MTDPPPCLVTRRGQSRSYAGALQACTSLVEEENVKDDSSDCTTFFHLSISTRTATAGLDVVQSGRPIFDDFFQHLWPYIDNNTANVVFQMVKRL
ncbi:hypothetical protein TNCV_3548961 [Trichonephila clavipes]|nr:hypothetical protein TNCV_3548961 [Trichonephila clavipes]